MTQTVTVGCKLPNGLILEMGKPGDSNYTQVVLKGANQANLVGGYGLTSNVSKEFMAVWLKSHSWLPAVRDGLVFVEDNEANATALALDGEKLKTGFERLDPTKMPEGLEADSDHLKIARKEAVGAFA